MFSCRLDNAKAITTILSCLSHGTRKDQQAQCEVRRDEVENRGHTKPVLVDSQRFC